MSYDNSKQNVPYSLYNSSPDFYFKCRSEDDRDARHLGRFLTFEYDCPNCGKKEVTLPPDYPYTGASTTWTCSKCAAVMSLVTPIPLRGDPKSITLESLKRNST